MFNPLLLRPPVRLARHRFSYKPRDAGCQHASEGPINEVMKCVRWQHYWVRDKGRCGRARRGRGACLVLRHESLGADLCVYAGDNGHKTLRHNLLRESEDLAVLVLERVRRQADGMRTDALDKSAHKHVSDMVGIKVMFQLALGALALALANSTHGLFERNAAAHLERLVQACFLSRTLALSRRFGPRRWRRSGGVNAVRQGIDAIARGCIRRERMREWACGGLASGLSLVVRLLRGRGGTDAEDVGGIGPSGGGGEITAKLTGGIHLGERVRRGEGEGSATAPSGGSGPGDVLLAVKAEGARVLNGGIELKEPEG